MKVLVIAFVVTVLFGNAVTSMILQENKLRSELFTNYDPEVYPAPPDGNALSINMSVTIRDMPLLHIREYRLDLDLIISLTWINHQLKWNLTKYPNVTSISTSKHKVWIPELISLPERLQVTLSSTEEKIFMHANGVAEWIFARRIPKQCRFDLTEFPRDSHKCKLSLHTHIPGHLVILRGVPSHIPDVKQNGAWTVESLIRTIGTDPEHDEEYAYNIELFLKRNPAYFVKKLVKPLLIISSLPLIGIFCPYDCGEKISLSVTSLLTLLVTLQYTLEKLPESDQDPEVVKASAVSLVMMVVHVLISCIVVFIGYRQGEPPTWLQNLFSKRITKVANVHKLNKDVNSDQESKSGSWVWRKLAFIIDWLGFLVFFLIWTSSLLPIFLEKH